LLLQAYRILDRLSVQLIFLIGELYTVSKHQSSGAADLQAFRGQWPELSGFWIADVERAARRRCNGAVTANLPASTEDIFLPAIISRHSDDLTSLLTPAVVLVVTL